MDEIERTIPHRPPFLFVDEIVEVRDDGATCRRTLREDEPQFAGHYPGNPIMPGVLLCEACFQTAAIYLAKRMEADGRSLREATPVLSRIGEAKFKRMAQPGDTLTVEVTAEQTAGRFHFLKGKVAKDDGVVLTVGFALTMVESEGAA